MANCENCYHFHMCDLQYRLEEHQDCKYYKDKSLIIEPLCEVGDTVWRIEDVWHLDDKETWTYHYEKEVLEFMVRSISIFCNSKGRWTKTFRICEVENGKTINNQRNIDFDDFGKTVFLSCEEAKKKLKEYKGE